MRNLIILMLIVFLPGIIISQEITLMSYNIRYDNEEDGVNVWFNRRDDVLAVIKKNNPEVLGIQEALVHQLKYLVDNTKYSYVGRGRDDGKEAGEFVPILFDTTRVKLLDSGMFWLSETPDKPTLGWDACCKRVVTWAEFESAGKQFFYFNTHFDHKGEVAVKKSSELLLKKVNEVVKNSAVFIGGDFNSTIEGCSYQYFVDPEFSLRVMDSYTKAGELDYDRPTTYRGFDISNAENGVMIDYIFFKNGIEILSYKIDSSNNSIFYFSDHMPIVIRANFLRK